MGSKAYGFVGFFLKLEAWFNLLNMRLDLTVARETSRLSSGVANLVFDKVQS